MSISLEDLRDFALEHPEQNFKIFSSELWLAAQYGKVKFDSQNVMATYSSITNISIGFYGSSMLLPPEYTAWARIAGQNRRIINGNDLAVIIVKLILKRDLPKWKISKEANTKTEIEKKYDEQEHHI